MAGKKAEELISPMLLEVAKVFMLQAHAGLKEVLKEGETIKREIAAGKALNDLVPSVMVMQTALNQYMTAIAFVESLGIAASIKEGVIEDPLGIRLEKIGRDEKGEKAN